MSSVDSKSPTIDPWSWLKDKFTAAVSDKTIKEWEEKQLESKYIRGIRSKILFTMSFKPAKHTVVLSRRNLMIKNSMDSVLLFELSAADVFPQLQSMLLLIQNGNMNPEPNEAAKNLNSKAQAFTMQALLATALSVGGAPSK